MPERRWFPGYNVAAVATVGLIFTAPGQTLVVSQFNESLRNEFGIGELALNSAYTVATVLASLPLVLVGSLTDRLGPRRMIVLTAAVFGLGCLAMAGATGFVTVAVGFFLLRFLGQGSLSMVCQHAVAMWFHRRLGSINGVKHVAVFVVWAGFPQATLWLIDSVGWRWTYVLFALCIWLAIIPLTVLFVVNQPEHLGLSMDNHAPSNAGPNAQAPSPEPAFSLREAMRTRAYWLIVSTVFIAPLIGTAFLFDMQPILALRGMDKSDAANAVSAWTITMAVMALPAGRLTDRLSPGVLMATAMALIGASALALWAAVTPLAAIGAMVVYGVGQSISANCGAAATARFFGRRHHGAIRSSITRIGVIGTGLGPLVSGLSAGVTGGYGASMAVFLAMTAPVALLCLGLKAPAQPVH